jgi:hypothetical protein
VGTSGCGTDPAIFDEIVVTAPKTTNNPYSWAYTNTRCSGAYGTIELQCELIDMNDYSDRGSPGNVNCDEDPEYYMCVLLGYKAPALAPAPAPAPASTRPSRAEFKKLACQIATRLETLSAADSTSSLNALEIGGASLAVPVVGEVVAPTMGAVAAGYDVVSTLEGIGAGLASGYATGDRTRAGLRVGVAVLSAFLPGSAGLGGKFTDHVLAGVGHVRGNAADGIISGSTAGC